MRPTAAMLILLSACGGISRPPAVAPVAAGANLSTSIAHEFQSSDPARAAAFYGAVLGGAPAPGPDPGTFVVDFGADLDALMFVPGDGAVREPARIEVLDLDAALVELAARTVPFALDVAANGAAIARVTDPDGRAVELRER